MSAPWPQASGLRPQASGLRLAEPVNELIGAATDRFVEYTGAVRISGVCKRAALTLEAKARSFDLTAHSRRLDAMQRVGYVSRGTVRGNMIQHQVSPARLQRGVDRRVERRHVNRPHEVIVQIVIVLCD